MEEDLFCDFTILRFSSSVMRLGRRAYNSREPDKVPRTLLLSPYVQYFIFAKNTHVKMDHTSLEPSFHNQPLVWNKV